MDNEEQIKKLEKELAQLSALLKQRQTQVWHLQQQIKKLNPNPASRENTQPFSLPLFDSFRHTSLESLIGLRLIHLVGIVVLVIGLSLGVKYAIDKNLVHRLPAIVRIR